MTAVDRCRVGVKLLEVIRHLNKTTQGRDSAGSKRNGILRMRCLTFYTVCVGAPLRRALATAMGKSQMHVVQQLGAITSKVATDVYLREDVRHGQDVKIAQQGNAIGEKNADSLAMVRLFRIWGYLGLGLLPPTGFSS